MTTWYIHPVNKVTNTEATRRLAESGEGSAGSFEVQQPAEDGKPYDVVALPYRLLREMYGETEKSGGDFAFIPFKRERSDETLKFVPEFLLKKSRHKKIRDAIAFVERQQAGAGQAEPDSSPPHPRFSLVDDLIASEGVTYRKY